MEVLADDPEQDDSIIVGLQDNVMKVETHINETSEHDGIKVLWSNNDTHMSSYEVIQEGIKVKSPCTDDEPSLGSHDMEETGDQILANTEGLSVGQELKEEQDGDGEGHQILTTEDMAEGHILNVPETGSEILSDTPASIAAATSLTTDLVTHGEHDVIQFLLPTSADESQEGASNGLQPINSLSTGGVDSTVITPPTHTVQTITLTDGNTALIQHTGGSKFLEGQTITLEDGTTAVIQAVTVPSVNLVSTSVSNGTETLSNGSTVKLEDTAAGFLNQAVKDSLQAIVLEDGTTAYLATQPPGAAGVLENRTLETTTLTLDQLTSQANVQGVLTPASVVSMDATSSESEIQTAESEIVGPLILEKGYRCKFEGCNRYYTTLHHLRVHERSHTGDRPFKCEYSRCGKAFATGYGLKSHIRVHTGEKPYKCHHQNCEKAFKTSGDLQKHVRTHTGERPFKCPFVGCDRSFTTSNIRKVHIRTHTGERPYICPEEDCGRAFASATNYKNHVRIHTGEKPYVCTVLGCGKRFTEYSSLYKHHVVHTHTKPYTCDKCGKTYRQTSTLAMHKRTAHGEDVTAETEALLYQQQNAEDMEPPDKRTRLNFVNQQVLGEDTEGALVINTSDQQQFAFVGGDSLVTTADNLQSPLGASQAILQQGNLAFTLGDQSQQVFVITDPAQLEALQQIAKHQIDGEEDVTLMPTISSGDTAVLGNSSVTMVTEIGAKNQDAESPAIAAETIHDIGNI